MPENCENTCSGLVRLEQQVDDLRRQNGADHKDFRHRCRPGPEQISVRGVRYMKETVVKQLGNLLSVKSLVTLTLTAVFAVMALKGDISQDFMTVYAVVIAFYFGTQSQKVQDALEGGGNGNS